MQVLEKILEEIEKEMKEEPDFPVAIGLKKAAVIIHSHMDDGWIPAEYPPEDNKPILLSFEFYDFTSKGRYIKDDKGGGAYFIDGLDRSCISQGIIVNAWYPLPAAPYRPKEEKQ